MLLYIKLFVKQRLLHKFILIRGGSFLIEFIYVICRG